METIFFIGIDRKGKITAGFSRGEDKEAAMARANEKAKYLLLAVGTGLALGMGARRMKSDDLAVFFERLYMLVRAGIPISKAIHILRSHPGIAGRCAKRIYENIQKGETVSKAMEGSYIKFPNIAIKLMGSGEKSGKMENTCSNLYKYFSGIESLKKEIIGISTYPAIVFAVSVVTFISVQIIIIPKFSQILYMNEIEVNKFSAALLNLGAYLSEHLLALMWIAAALAAGFAVLFKRLVSSGQIEAAITRISPTRNIYREAAAMVFCQIMSMTMNSGMNVLECIGSCKDVLTWNEYSNSVELIKKEVTRGESLSRSIERSDFFSRELVAMVEVGENAGNLDEIFEKMYSYYERNLRLSIKKFLDMLGPILILAAAFVIGAMMYLIIVPVMNAMNSIV